MGFAGGANGDFLLQSAILIFELLFEFLVGEMGFDSR